MGFLTSKIEGLKAIESQSNLLISTLIKVREKMIVAANVEQMNSGERAEKGRKILPRYAPSTVKYKRRKGQPFNRVTLKDSGDFHKSVYVTFTNKGFVLGARDSKVKYIEPKYTPEIYGLNEDNIKKLQDIVKGDMIKLVKLKLER